MSESVSRIAGTVLPKSVASKVERSPRRYSRIPLSVLWDQSLSYQSRIVYGTSACSAHQGNTASVGLRRIGEILGMSRSTTQRRIVELEAAGHIKLAPKVNGRRASYELTSPVFAQKQGKVNEVRIEKTGTRRYVAMEKIA